MIYTHRKDALLRRGLKLSHLRLLTALSDHSALTGAAEAMGISQPAASRLLAEIEGIVGHPVHERSGRGIEMTAIGRALARRARRVQLELDDAARDLAEIAAGGVGHVRLGTVTGAALDRMLPALQAERAAHPGVTFEVVVAASDALCDQLLDGRLDFALGRLPEGDPNRDLTYAPLDSEPVEIVLRRDHPLLRDCRVDALVEYDWILPPADSLMSRTVLSRLRAMELPAPHVPVATASFMLTLALLDRSDAVAALPLSIARQFAGRGNGLTVLPLDLGIVVEPYGLIARQGVALTPAARRLADLVQLGA